MAPRLVACPSCGERVFPLPCVVCGKPIVFHESCPKTAETSTRITRLGRRIHDSCICGSEPKKGASGG